MSENKSFEISPPYGEAVKYNPLGEGEITVANIREKVLLELGVDCDSVVGNKSAISAVNDKISKLGPYVSLFSSVQDKIEYLKEIKIALERLTALYPEKVK